MNDTEAEMLKRAIQGNEEAFTFLVEMYQTPVYNLCYRMLWDSQEAEDAAQETFWRAYQNIKSYDPNRSFITWLLSIAAHYCIDRQRKRKLPTLEIDAQAEVNIASHSPDPELEISELQDNEFMQQKLATLNPQDRAILVMKYWYDLSEKEIASQLSISTSAVKSRLFRARKELAEAWLATPVKAMHTGGKRHESPAF